MATLVAVSFSQSSPNTYPSLAPTFITWMDMQTGNTFTPPAITQMAFTGIYMFSHTTTTPFYFLLDGITVNSTSDRYVYGVLSPIQQVDIQLTQFSATMSAISSTLTAIGTTNVALGTTNVALGTSIYALGVTGVAIGTTGLGYGTSIYALGLSLSTLSTDISTRIGTTSSSYGTTSVDPGDLFGHLKRAQEVREGDGSFSKTTGIWQQSTRGGTLLVEKSLSQTSTSVTKT